MKERTLLFRMASCPYCMRAEAALDKAGVSYEKIDINPHDRKIVELLSGQRSVPIMVKVLGCESQDDEIVKFAAEYVPK